MRTGHFLKTMLATPSGPGALKVLSFQIACTSCSRVMGVQASAGSGYSKSVGTDKVSGGGGKRILARSSPFSWFVVAIIGDPSSALPLSVGILDHPPSPGGLFRYLWVVQMSLPEASSRQFCQCSFLALKIASASLLHADLQALWQGWSGRALNL